MMLSLQTSTVSKALVSDVALSWIDHDVQSRLIVDDELTILWANASARAALAKRRDIETRSGTLSMTQSAHQPALHRFITGSGASVSCWCIPCENRDGHLLLRAQQIYWDDSPIYGISFYTSGREFKARYASLDLAFGLTKTEHQVLMDLLDGHDADKLSEMRGSSIETIRSHIRHIYSKLGVNTREGLFRRVLPFRL